ncbi:hypothetical protein WJX77_008492 [Trebouxia sp. C0004]
MSQKVVMQKMERERQTVMGSVRATASQLENEVARLCRVVKARPLYNLARQPLAWCRLRQIQLELLNLVWEGCPEPAYVVLAVTTQEQHHSSDWPSKA